MGWVILLVLGLILVSAMAGKPKRRTTRTTHDDWRLYHAARRKAYTVKGRLETLVWKHFDDERYWDRILELYAEWLSLEEKAIGIECIGNDGTAQYTESGSLFYILARRHMTSVADEYVKRLKAVKHHDPDGKWLSAQAQVQRESTENNTAATKPRRRARKAVGAPAGSRLRKAVERRREKGST